MESSLNKSSHLSLTDIKTEMDVEESTKVKQRNYTEDLRQVLGFSNTTDKKQESGEDTKPDVSALSFELATAQSKQAISTTATRDTPWNKSKKSSQWDMVKLEEVTVKQVVQEIKAEAVSPVKSEKNSTEEHQSEVRKAVVALLNENGYSDRATEDAIQHIVKVLLKGRLPTEQELEALFRIQTNFKDGSSLIKVEQSTNENNQVHSSSIDVRPQAADKKDEKIMNGSKESEKSVKSENSPQIASNCTMKSESPLKIRIGKKQTTPKETHVREEPAPVSSRLRKRRNVPILDDQSEEEYLSYDSDDWKPKKSQTESSPVGVKMRSRRKRQRHLKVNQNKKVTEKKSSSDGQEGNAKNQQKPDPITDSSAPKIEQPTKIVTSGLSKPNPATYVDDVYACTKCILAFSKKLYLQKHMFRLHYDEFLRLKAENMWHD